MPRFINLDQFEKRLDAFGALTVVQANRLRRALIIATLTRLVLKTPVDFGIARGNWQVSESGDAQFVESQDDRSGSQTIERGVARAAQVSGPRSPLERILYIVNPTPYIEVLDQGLFDPPDPGPSNDPRKGRFGRVLVSGGFSTQAPQGIVQLTLEEVRSLFSNPTTT